MQPSVSWALPLEIGSAYLSASVECRLKNALNQPFTGRLSVNGFGRGSVVSIQQKLFLDWYASMTQLSQPFTQEGLLCCCQNSWWTWPDCILEACLFSILQCHAGNTPLFCSTSGACAIPRPPSRIL